MAGRRRANGEGSISERKNGGWMGQYYVELPAGRKRRTLYAKTQREVRTKLTEALAQRDKGIVLDDKNLTVGEYLDSWLSDAVRGTIRESTYSRNKYLIESHIKPSLGGKKLKNLNALHIQSFYRDRLDYGLDPATVQKAHHVLRKALTQAVRWDLIVRNPSDHVKAPTPSSKEMHPLSAEQSRQLLQTASGERFESLYVLAIHVGMRQGELLGLKWEDVDLDTANPTVRVRRTTTRVGKGGSYALGEVKTKSSRRTIRLTHGAVNALRSHRVRQAQEKLQAGSLYEDQGLVFAGEGGSLVNPSNLRNRSFKPLLARAGLAEGKARTTFHDLRHTCASLLFQRNVHPKFVQELLGHASVAITLDTYSHMLPGMGGEAADAMGEALG